MVTFVIGIVRSRSQLFHYSFVGYCMDILGRSYLLIMSESLGVKQRDVIHYYLNFKFKTSWTLAFPTNLFQLLLTKSAEQLQYVILMLISRF